MSRQFILLTILASGGALSVAIARDFASTGSHVAPCPAIVTGVPVRPQDRIEDRWGVFDLNKNWDTFPPLRDDPQSQLVQPKRPRVQQSYTVYHGIVTDIGSDWMELGVGWTGEESRRNKWIKENAQPKRISAAGTIPCGGLDGDGQTFPTYRLANLKVGDEAAVWVSSGRDGNDWTTEIWIYRRRGGKIPPLPGELFASGEWHMRHQAEQDWEEKGVPIPQRFLSDGRATWTKPPYPPVAPQPREVKR